MSQGNEHFGHFAVALPGSKLLLHLHCMAVEDALPMDLGELVIVYHRQSVKAEQQSADKEKCCWSLGNFGQ